jgi:hypothetical protein
VAAGFGGALVCALAGSFLAGGFIHLLALMSGGRGSYDRSYELISLLAAMAPVYFAVLWAPVPYLWILPTVYGTYLLIRGVALLHDAPETQACLVIGLMGVFLAAGQFLTQHTARRLQSRFETWTSLFGAPQSSQSAAAEGAQPDDPRAQLSQAAPSLYGGAGDPQAQSSVGMVQGPGAGASQGGGLPVMPFLSGGGRPPTLQEAQQMKDISLNMLDNVSRKMHDDPNLQRSMTPEQQAQMNQIMGFVDQIRTSERTPGAPKPDPQAMMKQVMQMMSQMQQGAPAQPGGPQHPSKKRGSAPAEEAPQRFPESEP